VGTCISEEKGIENEVIVLIDRFEPPCKTSKLWKSDGLDGALLSVKCCCFVRNPLWKSHAILN